jgi:hypothetical protein
VFAVEVWKIRRSLLNTGASWPDLNEAESRVLKIQTKLHQWATDAPDRRFDDLYNLVGDPSFLVVAWTGSVGTEEHEPLGSMA